MDIKFIKISLPDQPIYALGDLHGYWDGLKREIEDKLITDCAFVICGDIGVGFSHKEVLKKKFESLNKFFKSKNVTVIAFRGNHDDPEYFNRKIDDVEKTQDFWYSNLKLVPDYTVLSINGKNLLMVGGATSIDRTKRIHEHQTRIELFKTAYPKLTEEDLKEVILPSYWNNEEPFVNENVIKEITDDGILITHVLTHSAPSFCFPTHKRNLKQWFDIDQNLEKDVDYERSVMDNLYSFLLDYFHPLEEWVYGHFHHHWQEDIKGIRFTTLHETDKTFDPYEITRLNVEEIE